MNTIANGVGCAILLVLAAGCAALPAQSEFGALRQSVLDRSAPQIGITTTVGQAPCGAKPVEGELALDVAVGIALRCSPRLQTSFARMGFSQADLWQAGTLANPTLGVQVRTSAAGVQREFSLAQDLLNLLTLPARKQLAARELERTRLELAQEVFDLALAVRLAYYGVVADAQALELFRQAVEGTQAAAELSERQRLAGNVSKRDQAAQQVFYAQTLLDLARTETEFNSDREALNRLLGLWGAGIEWTVPTRVPTLPVELPRLDGLEATAISRRFDVLALKHAIDSADGALIHASRTRWLGALGIGYSIERETDGNKLRGPSIELGLPLFDRNGAGIRRLQTEQWQRERQLEALAIDVRSTVRESYGRLSAAHRAARHYENAILPLHQTILSETLKFYNGMLMGVYDLLTAQQNQLNAARDYVATLKEFWRVHAQLEHAIGGILSPAGHSSPTPLHTPVPEDTVKPEHDQHHHEGMKP